VLSRGRCRFGRFDLKRVPAAKRAPALALQLGSWSPFVDSDHVAAWSADGEAMVWCWDRTALLQAWDAAGGGRLPRIVPEPALRAVPTGGEGLRLINGLDGWEAQHWAGGQLLASRWWPALPEAAAQLAFQRDCGLQPEALVASLPRPDLPLADRPWAALKSVRAGQAGVGAAELAAYGVAALALALPALSLAVDQWRLLQARGVADEQLASESARSQGVLAVRDDAVGAAGQARALLDLQPFPPPLVHMLAIARALPESGGVAVREWEMADGKLRLLLASPSTEISGGDNVRALESTGLFVDVKIVTQSDPRQMAFSMNLKPQSALGLAEPTGPIGAARPVPPAPAAR